MARLRVPQPVSGGVLLSYKCSAECRHCMYACSPRWSGDWIGERELEQCLCLLAWKIAPSPWGGDTVSLNHGLHFSGGEPFLNFELLVKAVEMAHELKIPSTFVETNCFWCTNDDETREKLQLLRGAGLRGIMVSVNPFYAKYVPFERTERCVRISREILGRNVMVYQLEYYNQFKQLGIKERLSVEACTKMVRDGSLSERVELFLMGRATRELRGLYPAYPARTFFEEPCRPPLIRNWHNHFDNYGNFMPGYCGGISLGSWRDLDGLLADGIDLEQYPVLRLLTSEDMRGLLGFAADRGYQECDGGYLSKCDLCLDIRGYLVSKGDFDELKPEEFYRQLI